MILAVVPRIPEPDPPGRAMPGLDADPRQGLCGLWQHY